MVRFLGDSHQVARVDVIILLQLNFLTMGSKACLKTEATTMKGKRAFQ